MGDGETFQQLREGRIERHPLRETSSPRKRETKGLAVGRRRKREERERRKERKREQEECQDRRQKRGRSRTAERRG